MPDFIDLGPDDLDDHHLCCALGDPKHAVGVQHKKDWLRARMSEGLVFRKLDVRGKVFIEHAPSEFAWRPIHAPGWTTIHCLWVSGRYAGHGHGRALLESCIEHSRDAGRQGVVVATAKRKRPFLGDRRFFERHGFVVVDSVDEWQLLGLQLSPDATQPRFTDAVRAPIDAGETMVIQYTDQCPFNLHWAEQVRLDLEQRGHPVDVRHLTQLPHAQHVASPLGTYGLERQGQLLCHHLTTSKATGRLLDKAGIDAPPER